MTIEAVDAALGVAAHLVFVDDRVLLASMALGAFAGRAHRGSGRSLRVHARSRPIDQQRTDDQGECDHHRNEDGAEGQGRANRPAFHTSVTKWIPDSSYGWRQKTYDSSNRSHACKPRRRPGHAWPRTAGPSGGPRS